MYDICLFAGTGEGRRLAELLGEAGLRLFVCVATGYGRALLPEGANLHVQAERLDKKTMSALFLRESFKLVIDATHPHAAAVTENIRTAAQEAGAPFLRLLRAQTDPARDAVYLSSVSQAADYLKNTQGNILAATGSKELAPYTEIPGYQNRLFVRVLPMQEALAACEACGIPHKNILAMQGPFSEYMNRVLMRERQIRFLVTKDSGAGSGLPEKLAAAHAENVKALIIGRPPQVAGLSMQALLAEIITRFGVSFPREVSLIGTGPGSPDLLTVEAERAIRESDCLIGAERILRQHDGSKPQFVCIDPTGIAAFINQNPCYLKPAVLFSGDTGFYSGAKKLAPLLSGLQVRLFPGISSLQLLCARLQTPWEDAKLMSLHGRAGSAVPEVSLHPKVFTLVGGAQSVHEVCQSLCGAGLGSARLSVGERLSFPEERVVQGSAASLMNERFDPLCAVLIENHAAHRPRGCHLPDEAFERRMGDGLVPMTKAEVRAVSVAKLQLPEDAVVYDIGSGTGSVSVEIARACPQGKVYAIECLEGAADLTERNSRRFGCRNIEVIRGTAPEACTLLPPPSHAFIGGSSGRMTDILKMLKEKNPAVRVVINLVTLESIAQATGCLKTLGFHETDIVQLQVSRARSAGAYHMMSAQNPVMIISCQGQPTEEEKNGADIV